MPLIRIIRCPSGLYSMVGMARDLFVALAW